MHYQTRYFDQAGPVNTEEVLTLVRDWADLLDIPTLLVATTSGKTGLKTVETIKNHKVIVVSHSMGFRENDQQEMLDTHRKAIQKTGAPILTCQHAFGGIGRALRLQHQTLAPEELIANTLRLMGQGLKVAAEITLMAADAGLVTTTDNVIAIGGTRHGADTAAVIKPAHATRFFELKIRGILCKPWEF